MGQMRGMAAKVPIILLFRYATIKRESCNERGHFMIGTLINLVTVMVGGLLGLFIGNRLPERMKTIVVSAIGLMTFLIGVSSAIKTENALIPLLSLVIGGILGEAINIERASIRSATGSRSASIARIASR